MPVVYTGLCWGEENLPPRAGTEHFLVAGSSGSGKTILIERLLWSLLGNPHSALSRRTRFLLYDPKQEIVSKLYAMGCQNRVRILHPFDARSSAWDIATDIDGPVSARQAATLLVPERGGGSGGRDESFFDNAVRDLITGVMLALIDCVPNPNSWTFRDVILALLYEPYLRFLLAQETTRDGNRVVPGPPRRVIVDGETRVEETRTFYCHLGHAFSLGARLLQSYLDADAGDRRTVGNVRASINARLSAYEPLAAVWEEARKERGMFSLSAWIDGYDILVMGNDESARVALDAVNQLLFKRMTELLLSRPEISESAREAGEGFTWIFLDEVREAGQLDGLSRLMTKGRSKGICAVLGFQDIDGLRSVYGPEIAGELTGQCQNLAILQMSNPNTAEWATSLFGAFMTPVSSESRSHDQGGRVNYTTDRKEDNQSVLYSGEFIYLKKTGVRNGLSGYFRSKDRDIQNESPFVHLDWEYDIVPCLPRPKHRPTSDTGAGSHARGGSSTGANNRVLGAMADSARDFVPRPLSHQYLKPWDRADWARLGFPGEPPGWKVEKPSATAPVGKSTTAQRRGSQPGGVSAEGVNQQATTVPLQAGQLSEVSSVVVQEVYKYWREYMLAALRNAAQSDAPSVPAEAKTTERGAAAAPPPSPPRWSPTASELSTAARVTTSVADGDLEEARARAATESDTSVAQAASNTNLPSVGVGVAAKSRNSDDGRDVDDRDVEMSGGNVGQAGENYKVPFDAQVRRNRKKEGSTSSIKSFDKMSLNDFKD